MRPHGASFRTSLLAGVTIGAFVLAEATWFLMLGTQGAFPHQISGTSLTYSPECCNSAATSPTGDCAPIDDMYVTEESDGYHVNIPAGAHPRLKLNRYSGIVPYAGIKQPIDQSYHICLADEGTHRFCFFPKPGAV